MKKLLFKIHLIIFILFLFCLVVLNYTETSSQELMGKRIDICCTWGKQLKDSILTYSIEQYGNNNNNNYLEKIVNSAFSEWEIELNNIHFKNIKENKHADIEIKLENEDSGQKGGHALIYFDNKGFIDNVEISISKISNGVSLSQTMLEIITKHEIGHALGLGHSQFPNTLMYPVVDETITTLSKCEIDAAKGANNWKFIKKDKKPKIVEQSVYVCLN